MFGLSMTEIILIAVVALIVIGPKKLPDIAKSLGKGYGEFKRSFGDLKQSVNLDDIQSSKNSNNNNPAGNSAAKQDIVDQYKSQWEQKLPEKSSLNTQVSSAPESEEKKEGGDNNRV